jgi:hypothetical protein
MMTREQRQLISLMINGLKLKIFAKELMMKKRELSKLEFLQKYQL